MTTPTKKIQEKFDMMLLDAFRYLEEQKISKDKKSDVIFRGYGYMLHLIKKAYELEGADIKFEWLLNYAKNFEKIQQAQRSKVSADEIRERFICTTHELQSHHAKFKDPMFG